LGLVVLVRADRLRDLAASIESSENLETIVAAPALGRLAFLFDSIASSMLDQIGQLSILGGGENGVYAELIEEGEKKAPSSGID